MTAPQAQVRARLALAVAARDVADHRARSDGQLGHPAERGAVHLRSPAAANSRHGRVDSAVLIEIAKATDWVELGEALGLSESEARHRYGEAARMWLDDEDSPGLNLAVFGGIGGGMHPDHDPAGLAKSLGQW